MEFKDVIRNRRSIRSFTEEKISDEDLKKVLEAGIMAPSGKGINPWHFITVTNPEHIHALKGCRQGGPKMLDTATAVIAVLGDETKSDTVIEDSSIEMENMLLAATDLGLGACWLQIRLRPSEKEGVSAEDFVRNQLEFPQNMRLEALLVLGHPSDTVKPHTPADFPSDRVHTEKW